MFYEFDVCSMVFLNMFRFHGVSWVFQGFFMVFSRFFHRCSWFLCLAKVIAHFVGKTSDLFGGGGQVISVAVLSQMNQWLPCSCDFQKDGVNHGPMCLLWVDGHIGICIYTLED